MTGVRTPSTQARGVDRRPHPGRPLRHTLGPRDLDAGRCRRATLGEEAFATGEAAGRALDFDALLDELLAGLAEAERSPAVSGAGQPRRVGNLLSPREREVPALVAAGRSNKEIAAALFVAPSTIKTHVTSLLTKLGADNRAQLVTIATQRGLLSDSASGTEVLS